MKNSSRFSGNETKNETENETKMPLVVKDEKFQNKQKSMKITKKNGNIYGHLAKISIWNLKNCQNFKIHEKFKGVAQT